MWHLYPLRVPADQRRHIVEQMRAEGVIVQVNYMPAYWHPAFDPAVFPKGLCSVAEEFYRREISLPMHIGLSSNQIMAVVDGLLEAARAV